VAVCVIVGLAGGAMAIAQRGGVQWSPDAPYDGRFSFVRARYVVYNRSGWEFDYPWMEAHLMTMFNELTKVRVNTKRGNIMFFDDPELMKRPVTYLSEPGGWYVNEREAKGLRDYLHKGGFLIVDDFMENEWNVFERTMHMVLPDAKIMPLDISNPIFDSFYRIKTLKDIPYPTPQSAYLKAEFYGIYEDNDPKKRLMVVINYNTDLGDYMEWSDAGLWPVNLSNDAYKFMMNYIIYGLTF
jgi:hypothetical protein